MPITSVPELDVAVFEAAERNETSINDVLTMVGQLRTVFRATDAQIAQVLGHLKLARSYTFDCP